MPLRRTLRSVPRRLITRLRNRRHRCNFCGRRARFTSITSSLGGTLTSYGFPYGLDDFETLNHRAYGCPGCSASDRDRLYRLYLARYLRRHRRGGRSRRLRIVEFAPSPPLSAYLRSRTGVEHRTADLFMSGVDDVVDLTNMPEYADETIDFFVCSHVLEHVDDDARAYAELHRILVPGGKGIVMTPVAPPGSFDEDVTVTDVAERWRRFAQDDHLRLYDRKTLTGHARAAGFRVSRLGPWHLGPVAFWRHGITFRSRLYIVSKPN